MVKEFAYHLAGKIKDLPFLSRVGGLVQTLEKQRGDGSGKVERYPITDQYYLNQAECAQSQIIDMIPNTQLKGLAYFEDRGTSFGRIINQRVEADVRLRLVVWINPKQFQITPDPELSIQIKSVLLAKMSIQRALNVAGMIIINSSVKSIAVQDKNIFSKYTYNEAQSQYLLLPYQYFAFDLEAIAIVPLFECFTVNMESTSCDPETGG